MKHGTIKMIVGCIFAAILSLSGIVNTYADGKFSVSPMNQKIILSPGEVYKGSFKITNPAANQANFSYIAAVTPFYVDEQYNLTYENNGDYNQIVNWISLDNPEGSIAPNDTKELYFTIEVPKNAPAGGQYAAITVTSNSNGTQENAINIQAKYSIAHIIYAEIAGTTERHGEVIGIDLPSFLLSGNIMGTSSIKNTGNVHGAAKYTLQVFPLFSDEEIYTNEENPLELTILPNRTLYSELPWTETPPIGIFNAIYTIEFEGVTTQVSKLVIVCPIWLLFLIIFIIAALIIWIILRIRNNKRKSTKAITEEDK